MMVRHVDGTCTFSMSFCWTLSLGLHLMAPQVRFLPKEGLSHLYCAQVF